VCGCCGEYRDITAQRRAEVALELREARSQRFNRVLAELAGDDRLFRIERDAALRLLTEAASRTLGVARVGIWFFDTVGGALECADCFEQRPGKHQAGQRLSTGAAPEYFAALERWEIIAAGDAVHDPATCCLSEAYLRPQGIGAMLDVPVRVAGRVMGVICHEHIGTPRSWSAAEQSFASAMGSCVALVLEAEARRNAESALHAAHDRLNEIVEFLPDATFVIDANGVVTAWNRAMEDLTGVPKAAMLGRGDHEYSLPFYGDRRPLLIDCAIRHDEAIAGGYETFVAEGGAISGETQVPRLGREGGAYIWASARPLFDSQGCITGAIESIRDITQRRKAENEIVAWKKRYELVAVVSGQITYEYNLDTGFILWSESVGQVLGYSLPEMGGTTLRWLRLIHPGDRRRTAKQLHRSVRDSVPFDSEYRMRHSDGGYRWFRDCAHFIVTADRARCMIGMLTDITAAKQAAEALQRAHTHLEERVRERTAELATANERLKAEIAERERIQQALAASERKYRLMVDSLPQVVYELDLQGNIVVLNREGVKTARLPAAELASGANLFSLVHPDDHERLRANLARLIAGHSLSGEEYRFLRHDGTTFIASSYAQLIVQDGQPVGVTGFLIDETRRRHVEETLRKAHADLEDRVIQRTAELAESNASLRRLLEKQEMNIGLAHQCSCSSTPSSPATSRCPAAAPCSSPRNPSPGIWKGATISSCAATTRLPTVHARQHQGPVRHEVGCILRSIITDLIHNALIGTADAYRPLAETVTRLNREICRSHLFSDGDFFTSINLEIDHATLRMAYVVAGHPPFLHIRGTQVRLLPELAGAGTNLPVGMLEHHEFSARPSTRARRQTLPLHRRPARIARRAQAAPPLLRGLLGLAREIVERRPEGMSSRLPRSSSKPPRAAPATRPPRARTARRRGAAVAESSARAPCSRIGSARPISPTSAPCACSSPGKSRRSGADTESLHL
jgi:PAS domain S-box-containing protein